MEPVLAWLLEGDPGIRWQTLAHLCDAEPAEVAAERARVATEGWGARLLAAQDPEGTWGGGLYTPKWTSTTYTLLLLWQLGAAEAIEVVRHRGRPDGRWPLQNRWPGKTWFELEGVRQPSRWNTLRALRVLRWWDAPGPDAARSATTVAVD